MTVGTRLLRRLPGSLAVLFSLFLTTVGLALADGGPHGSYDKLMDTTVGSTDKCAACHRVHQGQSQGYLLKRQTAYELCVTCHDGTVSRLNVLDGVKLSTTITRTAGQTVTNGTLNGGGFEYVNGTAATSKHDVQTGISDPGQTQPWGYQARTGEKSGTLLQPLTCTSCHNPHGSANYRMLREQVNGFVVSVLAYGVTVTGTTGFTKQEGGPGLDTANYPNIPSDKYVVDYYGSTGEVDGAGGISETGGYQPTTSIASQPGDPAKNALALLCGSCHTTYPSNWGRGIPPEDPYGLGNDPAKYRHRTEMRYDRWQGPKYEGPVPNNPETNPYDPGSGPLPPLRLASNRTFPNKIVTCLTCHRAHGTAAQMTGWALQSNFGGASPDAISPAQTSASRSMLLVLDNRQMCEACHQW